MLLSITRYELSRPGGHRDRADHSRFPAVPKMKNMKNLVSMKRMDFVRDPILEDRKTMALNRRLILREKRDSPRSRARATSLTDAAKKAESKRNGNGQSNRDRAAGNPSVHDP